MNLLTRLEESVLVWSCGKVSETVRLKIRERVMQAIRVTYSPLIQRVDDLAENTERLIDGCRFLQSGRVVACQLPPLTQLVGSGRVNIEVLTQTLLFSEPARSTKLILPVRT